MIQLIEHVAITVRDLQETIDFYAKLGFKPTQRSETPTQTIQFLEAGQARLEVFIPKATVTIPPELAQSDVGIKHIALKVDDLSKSYEEAKARGVVFNAEPRRLPSGSVTTSLKDPNGILLQLIQR
jgi:catechol 2,3-dioxygenase-like lactoylglutathione lyase family enzyme